MKPSPELGIASPFLLISFSQRSSGQRFLCILRKPIVFLHIYCLGKDVKESTEHSKGSLSPEDLPNPGSEMGSPALQADSLPTELSGNLSINFCGLKRQDV